MKKRAATIACLTAAALVSVSGLNGQPSRRPVTVDDLMKLRAIVDARIAPDGSRIAYVVSTPSLAKNEHEAALYVVSTSGGTPRQIGSSTPIFNIPVPTPRLR